MLLPGKIELWALGDVLGKLLRAGVTGTLSLVESRGERAGLAHHVHLVGGSPAAVLSDGPRLGEMLAKSGVAEPKAVAAAVRKQDAGDARLVGELLSDLAASSPRSILDGLRAQTRARVDRLFGLGEARLAFRANALGDPELASLVRAARTAMPLQPNEFLHGRPRVRSGAPTLNEARSADLELLGLNVRASREEIRQAFKRLALKHHPDRARDDVDRAERNTLLARLAAAYSRLTQRA